ncbi:hypothetical protein FGG08_004214 [Glutinoglossum americanum]|uniref:Deoxyribose-phosphate aldolase n=1 Tax=Glutinoglossum americanum TaxID=1670608 RepID=A0A9P8I800_9PEZI|nr:hypothetical protein FGG08_004214 [Glutinoglossum americanum]
MDSRNRTNTEWKKLIDAKITEVDDMTSILTHSLLPGFENPLDIVKHIDHTALKPGSTEAQIDRLCGEARQYGFKLGYLLDSPDVNGSESYTAIAKGARELDMVIHIGALKSGNFAVVYDDILSISQACSSSSTKVILKAIVETALLTRSEIIAACYLAAEAGVDFVKTCTGFSGGEATIKDVTVMHKTVSYRKGLVEVKASGGVRNLVDAVNLCKAGASRIGTSAGVNIAREAIAEELARSS